MKQVRIGVIGCGVMGAIHARNVVSHPHGKVVALADLRPELAAALADTLDRPALYRDGETLIREADTDGIIIALPTAMRTPLALLALRQGRHLLVEKPVAMNAGEVEAMIAARGDLTAGCCSSRQLTSPSTKAAKAAIASGALGITRAIHSRSMMGVRDKSDALPPAWRLRKDLNGGGILMNWGCYDLDFLLGLFDYELVPQTLLAQTWSVPAVFADRAAPESDAETHFSAFVRCAGGEVITLERAEYVASMPADGVHLVGDRGALHLRMTTAQQVVTLDHEGPDGKLATTVVWEGESDNLACSEAVDHDFVEAVRDRRPCLCPLERALVVQKVTDAIYRSAETGKAQSV